MRGRRRSEASKARDHLVEDQQDVMFSRDRLKSLKISCGRNENASRAGNRLDDHRRNCLRAVFVDDLFELIGETCSRCRQATSERLVVWTDSVTEMPDARERRKTSTIVLDSAHRNAAKSDAMVAAATSDQPGPLWKAS